MKKTIILILTIIVFVITISKKDSTILIPNEAIRMRVISNSDTKEDVEIKNKVKDELQKNVSILLKDTKTIHEARNKINSNLNQINSNISNLLDEENYLLGYNLNYSLNYFPEKEYKGVLYKAGHYESLLVTLGEGKGNNWWCVLFPPLCLIEAEETEEKDNVEYKFWIKEIINKYF